eukprot:10433342-Karenia_brevis.AAC.1
MSSRMDEILHEHADCYKLPDDVAAEFMECTRQFLLCQNALGWHWQNDVPLHQRRALFQSTFKSHAVAHIGLLAEHSNPRHGWCYNAESWLRHVKTLAATCMRGNSQ